MHCKDVDAIALSLPHVTMDFKEEWDAFRYKIQDKMFAYKGANKEGIPIVTLKLSPQENAFYREHYEYIVEGYYMNKVHWISVYYEQALDSLLQELLEKSYTYVISTLSKRMQNELQDGLK